MIVNMRKKIHTTPTLTNELIKNNDT